jgi:hypothetical protein
VQQLYSPPANGSQTPDATDSALGPVIILPFADGPRFSVGKIFLPGIDASNVANNQISAGVAALILILIGSIGLFTSGGRTYTLKVVKRVSGPPTTYTAFIPQDILLSLKLGVQRRRLLPVS